MLEDELKLRATEDLTIANVSLFELALEQAASAGRWGVLSDRVNKAAARPDPSPRVLAQQTRVSERLAARIGDLGRTQHAMEHVAVSALVVNGVQQVEPVRSRRSSR